MAGSVADTKITVPFEALQVVFDTAVTSMDFGSGFLDTEEVNALREIAKILGVPLVVATPEDYWDMFYDDCPYGARARSDWRDHKEEQGL